MTIPTADTKAQSKDRNGSVLPAELSLRRLHLLRFGYLVVAVGLVVAKWPLIFTHDGPWPLFEGVETCMLIALSLLFFLGLRYPIKMLPILLFEIGWKLIWLTVIVVPLLAGDNLDPATLSVFFACLWVLIVIAVMPWRYVFRQFVVGKGDPWRSTAGPVAHQQ
jgi:hypothetical protein